MLDAEKLKDSDVVKHKDKDEGKGSDVVHAGGLGGSGAAGVFHKIQTEFAYEAQGDLLYDVDYGSAFYLRNKGDKSELRGADLMKN